MMRCFAILAILAAGTTVVAEDGAAPAAPLPRAAPLAPAQQDDTAMSTEDRLLRRIESAMRAREERIQGILRASDGVRPVATADLGAGLERPRIERDRALADLRAALDEWLGRTHRGERDVLDQACAGKQAAQVTPLSAQNRLSVAEILRELALDEVAEERARLLEEGLAEVSALPPEIPEHLRPRAAWLAVFFLAEQARTAADPARRADLAGRARAAAEGFPASFPASELAPAVAALVADLRP